MSHPTVVLYMYVMSPLPIQPLDMQVAGATAPNDQKCEELCLICVDPCSCGDLCMSSRLHGYWFFLIHVISDPKGSLNLTLINTGYYPY